jgi:pseudaminic acid synthase
MINNLKIFKRVISEKHPPLVIAEISANHNNSLSSTLKMIDRAAKIGVEAVKFQTFNLDDMTLKINRKEFLLKNQSINSWNNRSLYDLYSEAKFPFDWHHKVFRRAKSLGLICFSSVFDITSLTLLEKLEVPAYKIASLESLHFPLIESVSKTKKPIIISTGTLNLNEIDKLIKFLKKIECRNFALLHCVTEYPANYKNINLKTISYIKNKYKCIVGFSDHTPGVGAAISSISFGARIIEKHFKNDNRNNSLDKDFSLDATNMELLVKEVKNSWQSIGCIKKKLSKEEKIYKTYRRSVYAIRDIKKNETFNKDNVKIIRPGFGLKPEYFNTILGMKSSKNIKKGDPIKKKNIQFMVRV